MLYQDSISPSSQPSPQGEHRAARFRLGDEEFVVLSLPSAAVELPGELTAAERAVVMAVLQGKSNGEIAQERGTSKRTVANQLANAFQKLDINSRAELALRYGGRRALPG